MIFLREKFVTDLVVVFWFIKFFLEIKVSQFTINIDSREQAIELILFIKFNKPSQIYRRLRFNQ
ncbi:hypothetical protein B0A65_12570 [Flavobacterium frigidimaris]|uniref:Uncharacterized protein n=1 Tax=Flavobacterium frigidimaris TaxID=262320 RepID=A0ABX4BQ29_FLAFR|nr:hypothetical protein B0A65_12570 [Flavobacterium frigidimaris]